MLLELESPSTLQLKNNYYSLDDLGMLAEPENYNHPLDVRGRDIQQLIQQLQMMLLIRQAEEKLGDMVTAGCVKCPCHLGIGQEAIAVGVSQSLRPTDRVFGAHRSHTHFLALNGNVYQLFAEVLGKATGCSKGMGGSMHLADKQHGFMGSVPIVAASVPIATGAALAAKMDRCGDIAVSYFGDGAVEEGAVHESLNLASVMNLPIVFVCENNLFASHMHIMQRQPTNSTVRFAHAHGIAAQVVDGNDVIAVTDLAKYAIEQARVESRPFFIEAVTYRWRGHVGPREDNDVGVKRSEDLHLWKRRDPIERLASALEQAHALPAQLYARLKAETQSQLDDAWAKAEQDPYPNESALFDLVYYDN